MKLYDLTLTELRARLDNREVSSVDVTRAFLDRIAKLKLWQQQKPLTAALLQTKLAP
jgi:Asp-tRNA(Asn)/Glu-tRNA(Gln) amidotransferase A subunit family amidase